MCVVGEAQAGEEERIDAPVHGAVLEDVACERKVLDLTFEREESGTVFSAVDEANIRG